MTDKGVQIRLAKPSDLDAVRQLCRDYRTALVGRTGPVSDIAEAYYAEKDYEPLLSRLPDIHARPDGFILAAAMNGEIVGCTMSHRIDSTTCEIKRLFVSDKARGSGVAIALCNTAMQQAKADGYVRMVLDTVRQLPEAIRLYEKLGFSKAQPFYEVDPKYSDLILFFGRDL